MARSAWLPSRSRLVAAAALLFAAAGPVRANGAFPDEFSVHFPVNAPHRIYMGANFGMLVSEDDGATWRYSCEPWVVSGSNAALSNENVSFYQLTADGALLATSVTITRSADDACTWPTSGGSVTGQAVDDLFPDPNDASFVLAAVATSTGYYILASHDGGNTFAATHLYDTPDIITGIEIARSKPGVVYATTVSTNGVSNFIASTNSGAAWTVTPLNVSNSTQPRILAIDPADEKKVYLRLLNGPSDAMSMTADGGQTFQPLLSIPGQFSSFLRAGDGAIYAGTRDGKLYVKPAGATTFDAGRDAPHLRCLGQRPGTTRIYACGDMIVDGFSLAYSDDNAATFHPMMSFTQLLGPLACAPVQTNCAAHWERIQGVLGIGTVPDAGQGGGGGGGGGGTPSGGSHCGSVGAGATTLLLLLAFTLRRGSHS
jgi:hypothetical protein